MAKIKISYETARACGMRRPGFYLVGPAKFSACGRLPVPLHACPVCGCHVRQTRGWTWIHDVQALFSRQPCESEGKQYIPILDADGSVKYISECEAGCPARVVKRAGLIWIGAQYYKTESDFIAEAKISGVSRRLSVIPRDLKLSEAWVLLAHPNAELADGERFPAVFAIWKPKAIEYVKGPDDSDDKLDKIEKRGIVIVDVRPAQTSIYDRIEVN